MIKDINPGGEDFRKLRNMIEKSVMKAGRNGRS